MSAASTAPVEDTRKMVMEIPTIVPGLRPQVAGSGTEPVVAVCGSVGVQVVTGCESVGVCRHAKN